MGRPRRSQLLPLFRSEAQARVLASIFLALDDRFPHVARIATQTGLPYSTVQREVSVLEDAGLVKSSNFGTVKVVRPNQDSPIFEEVSSLVLKTYGPATLLAEAVRDADGVVEAYIFGSWAARYHGERGSDPGDIDVLVVLAGRGADADRIEEDLADAGETIGRDVNVVFTSDVDWSSVASPFLRTVRSRPLVPLVGGERDD